MTTTTKILTAIPGPPAKSPEWFEARRHGVTATEAAKLGKGYASDRKRILREKLTGDRVNLAGKPAVEYGNLREPMIAAWIERRFGIPASDLLYMQGADHRRLATPDGVEVDEFLGKVFVAEVKTSKHDLTPGYEGDIVDGVLVLTKGPGGKWYLRDNYFAKTGYYDQMQWQMFVMGAERTLFAWEQHDDDWTGWPERAPKTLTLEPGWCWVLRDEKRIAELVAKADEFMAEVEAGLAALEAGDEGVIPELSPEEEEAIEVEKRAQEIKHERVRVLSRQLVADREAVAEAEKARDATWKELGELLAGETDWLDDEPDAPRVSVVTNPAPTSKKFNREKALAKAPLLMKRYEDLVTRYTEVVVGDPKTTITVTKRKA